MAYGQQTKFEEFTLIPSWQTHIRQYSQPTNFGTCIKAKKQLICNMHEPKKSYPKHTRKSFLALQHTDAPTQIPMN